jgi:hypothetical protein
MDASARKVFCIGFQKTGTTSLHEYFMKNNMRSTHDPSWWQWRRKEQFSKCDCFTDGLEMYHVPYVYPDLAFLDSTFPNARYVFQTRTLRSWLVSRWRHGNPAYLNGVDTNAFGPDACRVWANNRNEWMARVLAYFDVAGRRHKLLVLDIQDPHAGDQLSTFLNVKTMPLGNANRRLNWRGEDVERNTEQQVDDFLLQHVHADDHHSTGICRLISDS